MTLLESEEIHRRALARIEDPFETVYEDVSVRSMRTSEIEIIEARMGDDEHSLTIYVQDEAGVAETAYKWEETCAGVSVYFHREKGMEALEILRRHQVLEDLSSV